MRRSGWEQAPGILGQKCQDTGRAEGQRSPTRRAEPLRGLWALLRNDPEPDARRRCIGVWHIQAAMTPAIRVGSRIMSIQDDRQEGVYPQHLKPVVYIDPGKRAVAVVGLLLVIRAEEPSRILTSQ